MTIQYKNAGINLSTTDTTSVLTAPSNAVLIVKQIQINNGSVGNVNFTVQVTDTSATATFRIFSEAVTGAATKDIINNRI